MASFEQRIKAAADAREIPGVVLVAEGKNGFKYQNAFGPKNSTEPISVDSTFINASCTKLMTSIAALQCVERGQIALDDDLSTVLTEFKGIQILSGFEEGTDKPILKTAEKKITLRHLLTHTSGFTYDGMAPIIGKWRKVVQGFEPGSKGLPIKDRLAIPLLFEPGTSWIYGHSTDWAGVLVARLNSTTLEEYFQQNIWDPLGIKNITFHSELKPDVKKNLVKMTVRGGVEGTPRNALPVDTGKPVEWTEETLYDDPIPLGQDFGGQGTMGSPVEYMKILVSLLLNDGKVLKPQTVDLMFTPQLGQGTTTSNGFFYEFFDIPIFKDTFASLPVGTIRDHGLGGLLVLNTLETGMKRGTLSWSGLPNLLWTIDREAGLATFYASNVLPFGDKPSHRWQQAFEKEMYSRSGSSPNL